MSDGIKIIGSKISLKLINGERIAVNFDLCDLQESGGKTWISSPIEETFCVKESFDEILEALELHRRYLVMESKLRNQELVDYYDKHSIV